MALDAEEETKKRKTKLDVECSDSSTGKLRTPIRENQNRKLLTTPRRSRPPPIEKSFTSPRRRRKTLLDSSEEEEEKPKSEEEEKPNLKNLRNYATRSRTNDDLLSISSDDEKNKSSRFRHTKIRSESSSSGSSREAELFLNENKPKENTLEECDQESESSVSVIQTTKISKSQCNIYNKSIVDSFKLFDGDFTRSNQMHRRAAKQLMDLRRYRKSAMSEHFMSEHDCEGTDAITSEPLDEDHVVWRKGTTYCYNACTLAQIARIKGEYREPPTFLAPMAECTREANEKILPKHAVHDNHVEDSAFMKCLSDYYFKNMPPTNVDMFVCPLCYYMCQTDLGVGHGELEDPLSIITKRHTDFEGAADMCFRYQTDIVEHIRVIHNITIKTRTAGFSEWLQRYKIRSADGMAQKFASAAYGSAEKSNFSYVYWSKNANVPVFCHLLDLVTDGTRLLSTTFPIQRTRDESQNIWETVASMFCTDGFSDNGSFLVSEGEVESYPSDSNSNSKKKKKKNGTRKKKALARELEELKKQQKYLNNEYESVPSDSDDDEIIQVSTPSGSDDDEIIQVNSSSDSDDDENIRVESSVEDS